MRKNIIVVFVASILVLSFVSAIWPFDSGMTGNVVKDNTAIDDSNLIACSDSDGGIFSENYGEVVAKNLIGRATTYADRCYSKKYLKEFYCNNKTGKKAAKRIRCEGECRDGACVVPDPTCSEVSSGVVRDEYKKTYRSGCYDDNGRRRANGKNYREYSCDGTNVIVTETECSTKCSHTKGCWGDCQEVSDTENDKDVPGEVILDGVSFKDTCNAQGTSVIQYACGTGSRTGYKRKIGPTPCGRNRECVTDANGIGYCRDKFVSSGSGETITTTLESLQEAVDDLLQQIAELEARITALESA